MYDKYGLNYDGATQLLDQFKKNEAFTDYLEVR